VQNRATLTGYLGQDAVLRAARNQTPFTVLSLATHRTWKDRNSGERQSVTTWHRCVLSSANLPTTRAHSPKARLSNSKARFASVSTFPA
jgi:hypothetical protein